MELLSQWGESGFEKYVTTMQAEYQRRAAVLQAAVEKVGADLISFVMSFHWAQDVLELALIGCIGLHNNGNERL